MVQLVIAAITTCLVELDLGAVLEGHRDDVVGARLGDRGRGVAVEVRGRPRSSLRSSAGAVGGRERLLDGLVVVVAELLGGFRIVLAQRR